LWITKLVIPPPAELESGIGPPEIQCRGIVPAPGKIDNPATAGLSDFHASLRKPDSPKRRIATNHEFYYCGQDCRGGGRGGVSHVSILVACAL
jgi:hypothetical protein